MTPEMHPLTADAVDALLNTAALPEEQRIAFYRALFAMASADGTFQSDELDLIFETVDGQGLSAQAQQKIWDSLIEPFPLTHCTDVLASASDQVRCVVMAHLIAVALADKILDINEEMLLLQARDSLQINQRQIEAVEWFICNVGIVRPRLRDYHVTVPSLKQRASVFSVLGFPATAVYLSSILGGIHLPERFAALADHGPAFRMLGLGSMAVIGAMSYLTTRMLNVRGRPKHAALRRARRRRAQLAVRNLQEAISYLTTRAQELNAVTLTDEVDPDQLGVLAERLRVLEQMIRRRQPAAGIYGRYGGMSL